MGKGRPGGVLLHRGLLVAAVPLYGLQARNEGGQVNDRSQFWRTRCYLANCKIKPGDNRYVMREESPATSGAGRTSKNLYIICEPHFRMIEGAFKEMAKIAKKQYA